MHWFRVRTFAWFTSPPVVVVFDTVCPGAVAAGSDGGIGAAADPAVAKVNDMNAINAIQYNMFFVFMVVSPISVSVIGYRAMHENLDNFPDVLFQFLLGHSGAASHDLLGPEIGKQDP